MSRCRFAWVTTRDSARRRWDLSFCAATTVQQAQLLSHSQQGTHAKLADKCCRQHWPAPHEALSCGNPAATAAQSSFFMLAARHSLITCSSAVSSAPPVPHVRVGAPFTYMPLSHHRIRLAPTVDAGAVGASLCDLGCFDAQNVSILAFRDGCSTGLAHSMLQQPFFGQFQHTAFPQPASFFTAASATSIAQTQPMWFSVRLQARLPKTVS